MNEVTLVKVTLNEATDPDLYAYIMRYENPRLRAGAFRALARAALLNDRGHSGVEALRALEQPPIEKPRSSALPGSRRMRTDEIESTPNPGPAPVSTTSQEVAAPATKVNKPDNVPQFNNDAIADQFEQF
ncbi:hypothetical protein WQE_24312 [Paraburkholderia hospita]|uniref:HEAT repeat domain-containing protein n=1 Tax=Paraburkholderia hospita TaxID=169430 RepID=A0ABP2PLI3_9BURK|nr:hypothetical protein [Paraburkholderia hospita]EIM98409.1 hypothetical protein WQE_24312 [Paraburkholderia hospita]OUL87823.1 hypothetical protein CA602_12780 [Paraburkholderia hospita]